MSIDSKNKDNAVPLEDEESIDEILNNIKYVITGAQNSDDVLVLTDKIQDKHAVSENTVTKQELNDGDNGKSETTPQPNSTNSSESKIDDASKPAALTSSPDILEQLDAEVAMSKQAQTTNTVTNAPLTTHVSPSSNHLETTPFEIPSSIANDTLVNENVAQSIQSTVASMINNAAISKTAHKVESNLSSQTFENVVVSLLKAELQKWLNEHLEETVKSIVEHELKRILPK